MIKDQTLMGLAARHAGVRYSHSFGSATWNPAIPVPIQAIDEKVSALDLHLK